jgi:gas vesicle protein
MFNSKQESSVGFFEGILIGGSIGVITTLLMTTQRGKKIQKQRVHTYKKWEHKAEDLCDHIQKGAHTAPVRKLKKMVHKMAKSATSHHKTARKAKHKGHSKKKGHR